MNEQEVVIIFLCLCALIIILAVWIAATTLMLEEKKKIIQIEKQQHQADLERKNRYIELLEELSGLRQSSLKWDTGGDA